MYVNNVKKLVKEIRNLLSNFFYNVFFMYVFFIKYNVQNITVLISAKSAAFAVLRFDMDF